MSYLPGKPEDYIGDKGVDGGTTYILIPNYEGWEMLAKCIKAIEKNIECFEPQILMLYESEQIGLRGGGFTGACNKLMKMALSDPTLHGVYIVGNDTEVLTKGFHHKVLAYAKANPDVGSIMFAERIPGDTVSRIPCGYEAYPLKQLDILEPKEIVYPMLAFAWIRGEALRKVGILDERFSPGYSDDFSWGVEAWIHGYRTIWHPQLQFNHLRGVTMGKLYPNSGAEGARKFYEKYPYLHFGQDPNEVLKILKQKGGFKT